MASVSLARSDLFPVGTSVGLYPAGARQDAAPPTAAVIASGTVDAAGALSVTNAGILSYTDYVAYAKVGAAHRYARVRSTLDVHTGPKLTPKQRVAARRTAIGTS